MDIEEVRLTVEQIRKSVADPEGAHSLEDRLMIDFIEYVEMSGSRELEVMAREILKTQDIEFPRWRA